MTYWDWIHILQLVYWYIITTIAIDIGNEFKWKLICIGNRS